jgi:hypothetical protein
LGLRERIVAVEVIHMSQRFQSVVSSPFTLRAGLLVAACALGAYLVSAGPDLAPGTSGEVEIATTTTTAAACTRAAPTPAGRLELRSFDDRSSLTVTERDLAPNTARRHALPPGLYSVSWVPKPGDATTPPSPWTLREAKVLSVLPGKIVTLHLNLDAACGPELARHDP